MGGDARIELLWFEGCPNHEAARSLISDVLRAYRIEASVDFIEILNGEMASRLRFPGSPTIRVNGVDIEPGFVEDGPYGLACRPYLTAGGAHRVPKREWLVKALSALDC